MKKNKWAMAGGLFLLFIFIIGAFAPLIAPYSFNAQDTEHVLNPPNSKFWFGTDGLGRDLLSRVVYGARVSMSVGLVASTISLFIGTIYGAIAGYFGGKIDAFFMRTADLFQSVPA